MRISDFIKRYKQRLTIFVTVFLVALVVFSLAILTPHSPVLQLIESGHLSSVQLTPQSPQSVELTSVPPGSSGTPGSSSASNTATLNPGDGNPVVIRPSAPGTPTLEKLEMVTDQAFGDGNTYVPNSWGPQKDRLIRTSTGDLFTVFISAGSDDTNRQWHLMHRSPNGGWQEIKQGNAGAEPINILRGPHDEIHLFAWPGTSGSLQHLVSTDLGKTFTTETIPGQWDVAQGYSGAGINDRGDIVFFQSGQDQPGTFQWTYHSSQTNKWTFHISRFDYRYTYAYFFPGYHNDLTIVGMRDVQPNELNYSISTDSGYVFNAIKYFYISDVNRATIDTQQVVAQVAPQGSGSGDITYLTDSYIDTQGRIHILYDNQYDGFHHIIISNGHVKDVQGNIDNNTKARIIQDTVGHFYIIATSKDGNSLNVYPGTSSDTDGTQLEAPVQLNISQLPGCSDYDFCHSPTFTVPRNGHALANTIDGVYGNFTKEMYFRIKLR